MAQQVRDLASLQLQLTFDPWPGALPYAMGVAQKRGGGETSRGQAENSHRGKSRKQQVEPAR